jgi:dephospho-CoA kinase
MGDFMLIGITGSIASGKSIVLNYLSEKGYYVIDSDKLVKEELQDPSTIATLVDFFGKQIIQDNQINRRALGDIIFHDATKREFLNHIIHPKVIDKIEQLAKNRTDLVFVDVPLLFEANMEHMFAKIIVVYVDKETQIKRLMRRDQISEEYAQIKIAAQWDLDFKISKDDYVIDNNKRITHTQFQVEQILRSLNHEN